jgi:hypothetical protein
MPGVAMRFRILLSVGLSLLFASTGRSQFQFRAEAFNLFDRPNFNNPGSVFGTATFGRITSAQSMRQVQLGPKLLF